MMSTPLLNSKGSSSGVDIIGVGIDFAGVPTVNGYVTRQKINFPVYADPEFKLGKSVGILTTPAILVIDGKGKVESMHIGWDQEIAKIMGDMLK